MQITTRTNGDTLVVQVHESRIDAAVAIQFKDTMRGLIEAAPARLVLDLSRVEFIDSSGLGAIVAVMKLLAPDRSLELAGLTPAVAKVFRLTHMNRVFTIHENPPQARCPSAG